MTSFQGNVLGLLAGQFSRLALQAAYFVILARMLGASDYGAFALALALSALATPFSSLGTNTLMLKNVARDNESAADEWKRAASLTLLGGMVLAALLTVLADLIAPPELSRLAICLIALSELVGVKLVELTGMLWQSKGRSRPLIVLPTLLNSLRLIAAGATFLWISDASLDIWAVIYAAATLPLGIAVAAHTTFKLGYKRRGSKLCRDDVKEGMLYSVALSSQNVYNDIDKAMLGSITSAGAAGLYSAAFRMVDMAYAPIRAISSAAYPLYFREGEAGLSSALKLTKKIFPAVVGLGIIGAVAAVLLAPLAPLLLGPDYVDSVSFVKLLAPLIILRGMTFLAADTLTGCGQQGYRTAAQIAVAIFNVGLNLFLIPTLGILGAVISTLACEFLLASTLWVRIGGVRRKERRRDLADERARGADSFA